ncbi:MAG: HEPN domain-containing protein, partial [Pseudomonadota bacterium]
EFLSNNLQHIRGLSRDINSKLEGTSSADQRLRNEVAGMFAVTIAASYEGIVKDTLISYAGQFHPKYKDYVEANFKRLNARISIGDLGKYSRLFGLEEWTGHGVKKNSTTFHKFLQIYANKVERRFRTDLVANYENIFKWRHAYAHERSAIATFNEVYEAHRVAQYVILSFVKSFEAG